MILIATDDVSRYRIALPEECQVKFDHGGFDYLVVPGTDEPGNEFWLFDEILVEAARDGEFGLRLLAEERM